MSTHEVALMTNDIKKGSIKPEMTSSIQEEPSPTKTDTTSSPSPTKKKANTGRV